MAAEYRAVQGDTFDMVSFRLFENENYCEEIMLANPDEMDTIFFEPGQSLNIPDVTIRPEKASLPPWYED